MAINPDPNETLRLVLSEHDELENPPAFICRNLRRRERKRLAAAITAASKASDTLESLEAAFDGVERELGKIIVGWENQTDSNGEPIPFDINDLDVCLDEKQMIELASLAYAGGFGETEKKASGSQSPSSTAGSASGAGQEDALTDQAQPNPSSSPAESAVTEAATAQPAEASATS